MSIVKKTYSLVGNSITKKIIVVFSLLIISVVIIIISFNTSLIAGIIRDKFIKSDLKILDMVNRNIEDYLNQLGELSLSIRNNDALIKKIQYKDNSYILDKSLGNQLISIFFTRIKYADLSRMEFYTLYDKMLFTPDTSIYTENYILDEWYQPLINNKSYEYFESAYNGNRYANNCLFVYRRAIIDLNKKNPMAIVTFYLNSKALSSILADAIQNKAELVSLWDNNNGLFFMTDRNENMSNFLSKIIKTVDESKNGGSNILSIDNKKYLFLYSISNRYKWKLIKMVSMEILNSDVTRTNSLNLILLCCVIIAAVVAITLMSKKITHNITTLVKRMDDVADGNLNVTLYKPGNDEIGHLYDRFNNMLEKINTLINEEYKLKISEKNAILKAMEAQLNPHFLYNSLQVISTTAIMHNEPEIHKMINALSYILRYSFRAEKMVTVGNEIEYINKYNVLLKARFKKRLTICIYVGETIMEFKIPKLLLQALLENTVKHVVEVCKENIKLSIKIELKGDILCFRVSNNGPGIGKERLEEIRSQLQMDNEIAETGNGGIGLHNLFVRLMIIYGNRIRFEITSAEGEGTHVYIEIPIKE